MEISLKEIDNLLLGSHGENKKIGKETQDKIF
jgi:hypothetical protein